MSQQLNPETKANNILKDVFVFIHSHHDMDNFTRIRLVKEIDELPEIEPKLVLKGLLHYAVGSFEDGESYFKAAVQQCGTSAYVVENHIGALSGLGRYRLINYYYSTYAKVTESVTVLFSALETACKYLDLPKIRELLARLEPMEVGLEDYKEQFNDAKNKREFLPYVLDKFGIEEELLNKHVDVALKVLEENNSHFQICGMNFFEEEGIDLYFRIDSPYKEVADLNEKLFDAFLDEDLFENGLTIRFRPLN